jgi:hypothetical protein
MKHGKNWSDSLSDSNPVTSPKPRNYLARIVLVWFVFIFISARVLVLLIMLRDIPDLFLHIGQTHVHHLNYGIFLLCGVGAFLLFERPNDRQLAVAAAIYGIALALTFDEFGMWVHLGGSYWQRASFDACTVIAAILSLIALAPRIRKFRTHHWLIVSAMAIAVAIFSVLLWRSVEKFDGRFAPILQEIEQGGPT